MIRSSPDATPSSALRNPENVTDDLYLGHNAVSPYLITRAELDPPVFRSLYTFVEGSINVLNEYNAPLGRIRQQVDQLVIGESSLGQVHEADVVRKRARESLNKGRLSRSRRTVQ